jgi:1,4-alpha-glucan branching enzyme
MPISQLQNATETPMGVNLVAGGATIRIWAPAADDVYILLDPSASYTPNPGDRLFFDSNTGYWSGFLAGCNEGATFKFWIKGKGSSGFKRDPYARELSSQGQPNENCIARDPSSYAWHDSNFQSPRFNDLIVYQFHIGAFYGVDAAGADNRPTRIAKFLDVLKKLEYFAELGVTAIEPLPVTEYNGAVSLGYNGVDIFSPEMDYSVTTDGLAPYLQLVNTLLQNRLGAGNFAPVTQAQLEPQANQLKVMVDLCHVYGIGVIFDVVYNHGGGFDRQDQCMFFLDRETADNNNNSLYFTDQGWAGGLVYAYWKKELRQFLIDNATFFLKEYHIDGIRYDEVTVIDNFGGWNFCQDLTSTVHFVKPSAIEIAEFWRSDQTWVVKSRDQGGAGFDSVWSADLRNSIRSVLAAAGSGASAALDLDPIRDALYNGGFTDSWRKVHSVEDHDEVYLGHSGVRIAAVADPSNSRSWYGRSRSRVATGLVLTAPGIPMLFMGQEFLEDKSWSDNRSPSTLIWWDGLGTDKSMMDHLRFTQELTSLRRRHPGLRGEGLNVFHVHNGNRILAFQRWVQGTGRDVVVVVSLNESTYYNHSYQLGFPLSGQWYEVFNSDIYDNYFNPRAQGNYGGVSAGGQPLHGLPFSAGITIPANSIVVFARDNGD